jgi:tetratricopeptide (TPR) repeat protein
VTSVERKARVSWRGVLLLASLTAAGPAHASVDPSAAFDLAVARAEAGLQEAEPQIAESHYRSALVEGWLILGTLDRIEGRLPDARDAFRRASVSAVENRLALQALALVHVQMGEAAEAVSILRPLLDSAGPHVTTRRLLAQALAAGGQADAALAELETAHGEAPDDLELSFALAHAYLDSKKVDAAAGLFDQILAKRPIPQTNVLLGRAYSEFGLYDRARAQFAAALKRDPRARHAHYYLGVAAVREKGREGLEAAAREFQAELKIAPEDPLANRELGVALVDLERPREALPALEIAARDEPGQTRTLYYLGRAQLASDQPTEARASLERALRLAQAQGANSQILRTIHIQLGHVLQRLGQAEAAAQHFGEAERTSAEAKESIRERFLAGSAMEDESRSSHTAPILEDSPLATLSSAQRVEVRQRVTAGIARAYLNLGVMRAQARRFDQAALMFEKAAAVDGDFPQVQSSLGLAYFNAKQFDKAIAPLGRALEKAPDPALRRLMALAELNTEHYDKAVELLQDDPERFRDTSLQFAYGLALVKSGRAAEAERIFSGLLARNGGSAELNVLLGQANAALGDFDSAVTRLKRALELKPDVAEANAALGVIYYKQGKMDEAEAALRAELLVSPNDYKSQQNLAAVLESQQRPEEALPLLRAALQAKPDFADARYLLGKILLAQGDAEGAIPQLEAAVRLSPEDAYGHYQLARAYQKVGRAELAQKELDVYRQIKDKHR